MGAGTTLSEAVRPGHPAVVITCCLLLVFVVAMAWLRRARRPIPPPRGKLTVGDLQSRLDHEVLAEIEQARLAEFQRLAEKEASERAMADTTVIPRVEHANGALSPVPPVGDCRSYAGIKPRNEAAQQVRFFSP